MSFRNPLTLWLFQGNFDALFEHETAIEFQKVDSILRFFAFECFHLSKKRKLRYSNKTRFSEKFCIFDFFVSF